MYKTVSLGIENIVVGDVLAEDVETNGMCLLKAECEVDERLLGILEKKGIPTIAVYREVLLGAEKKKEILADMTQQLDYIFRLVEKDKTMLQIKKAIFEYKTKDLR